MNIKKTHFSLLVLASIFSTTLTFAHNKVVVVPLGGGEFVPLENVVTVSGSNADFTDINAAINSISGESETNPYLVVIGPGVYEPTNHVVMRPYISVTGSGPESTFVKASVTATLYSNNGVVLLASNTTLSNLSVENTATTAGGSDFIVGVMAVDIDSYTAKVKNVSVLVGGTSVNSSRGIYSEFCDIIIEDSHVVVEGPSVNYGLRNRNSNTVTRNTLIEVSGGSDVNRGSYETGNSTGGPSMFTEYDQVTIFASGANSHGLYESNSTSNKIRLSHLSGETSSVRGGGSSDFSLSTLSGGPVSGLAISCITTDDGDGSLLDSSCE